MLFDIVSFTKFENPKLYEECLRIRTDVFVKEQKIDRALEIDIYEDTSYFFLLKFDGIYCSTGRTREVDGRSIKFERIATLKDYRGKGLGKALMSEMQYYCLEKYPNHELMMNSQESALGFYESIGWRKVGAEFHEAGIPHYKLVYCP